MVKSNEEEQSLKVIKLPLIMKEQRKERSDTIQK
jgi:hypothetical protein